MITIEARNRAGRTTTMQFPEWFGPINKVLSQYDMRLRQLLRSSKGVAAQVEYNANGFMKYSATPWVKDERALYELVYETLEVVSKVSEENRMNIFSSELFKYLTGEMIGDGEITMTIKDVWEEELTSSRGSEKKPVMSFRERSKLLALNKTNARFLAGELGKETEHWKGRQIVLSAPYINAFGERMRSVTVKRVLPPSSNGQAPAKQATPPSPPPDDDPFPVDEAPPPEPEYEQIVDEANALDGQASAIADLRSALEEKVSPEMRDVVAAVMDLGLYDHYNHAYNAVKGYPDLPEGFEVKADKTLTTKGALLLYDYLVGRKLNGASEEEE